MMAIHQSTAKRVQLFADCKKNIVRLAQFSKRGSLNIECLKLRPHIDGLEVFLKNLEEDSAMTPELKQQAQLDKILDVICNNPEWHFPQTYVDRAKALKDKFEAVNWGGLQEIREEEVAGEPSEGSDSERAPEAESSERPAKRRKSTATTKQFNISGDYKVIQPPPDHPIWGRKGIMHGIALRLKPDGSLSKALNPAYDSEKRDHKVHSHNGIPVGQWFPNRLAAIFAGAHGASQAGISGSNGTGAYSVVVSGMYEDLDKDEGETVYYSGSGSHENEDPKQPAKSTTGTRILHASLKHQRPLRLLRTSGAVLKYSPAEGLRYDGLYKVVAISTPKNGRGGLYERFKLVRDKGQTPLSECLKRPNEKELRDYNKINAGYSGSSCVKAV